MRPSGTKTCSGAFAAAAAGGVTAILCASSLASMNTFIFETSNVVSPDNPSVTITLWAQFEPRWFAFGETRTAVFTPPDNGMFSDPQALLDPFGFSAPGAVSPDGDLVSGVYAMQLYVPFGIYPDSANPIPLWSVAWTTDDFTPRRVPLGTESDSFVVYKDNGDWYDFIGTNFAEGVGFITVVPAPAAAPLFALAVACAPRRRRVRRW